MNLTDKLELAKNVALQAGEFLLQNRSFNVEKKAHHDYVTECDRAAEKLIRSALLSACPQDGFYGEEFGQAADGAQGSGQWIVDPIDGTTNFIKNIPTYTVSIAYEADGQIQLGVVLCPPLDELFWAQRGVGAFLNGKPIRVSSVSDPGDAVSGMGFCHRVPQDAQCIQSLLPALVSQLSDLRRLGSAAFDLCCVACGRYDAFFELGLHLYDFAAGWLIVEEAGGIVTGWPGDKSLAATGNVLATNSILHPWFEQQLG